jgi:2'-hydroxyisoflavone reductase
MRLLVLGGTAMVGRAVAAEALRRGHDVVCAARGSAPVAAGAALVRVDRDAPGGLDPLRGERFDAVVDVATISAPWVAGALAALAAGAGHWTFVSTVNVYADEATPGQRADAARLAPLARQGGDGDTADYGRIKVASEDAVFDAVGGRAFVVRPGLLTGPGDRSDRFGYWPARFARGGRVVVPDSPDQPVQFLDARDLAAWIVTAGEQRLTGAFDAVGPVRRLPDLLREIADAVGTPAELVPVAPERLVAAGVQPWGGPNSLPLWLPPELWGVAARDNAASLAAGLTVRPLADAVAGALAHERELGLDRDRRSGVDAAAEAALLAA